MNYHKTGVWIKGYLDAIKDSDNVTKTQLEHLTSSIKDMVNDIEEKEDSSQNEEVGNDEGEIGIDDLPF